MGRITRAQYNHILEMQLAGKGLDEIQAYMADCILANDGVLSFADLLEVEKERVEKERKESMED